MLTHEELNRDPWSTYPVSKAELRELIDIRDYAKRYDGKGSYHVEIHAIHENADGTADVEFTLGKEIARMMIRDGILAALKKGRQ